MKMYLRGCLLVMIISLVFSIIAFYGQLALIGSGSDKVGAVLLAMLLSPVLGFILGIPVSIVVYRRFHQP